MNSEFRDDGKPAGDAVAGVPLAMIQRTALEYAETADESVALLNAGMCFRALAKALEPHLAMSEHAARWLWLRDEAYLQSDNCEDDMVALARALANTHGTDADAILDAARFTTPPSASSAAGDAVTEAPPLPAHLIDACPSRVWPAAWEASARHHAALPAGDAVDEAMVERGARKLAAMEGHEYLWPHYTTEARECLTAALTASKPAGDAVVVPREPTPEMLRAWMEAPRPSELVESPIEHFGAAYRAMIAAWKEQPK